MSDKKISIQLRPRRNRKSTAIRDLVQETRLHPSQFVAPLFVQDEIRGKTAIKSMPGVYRHSIDFLLQEIEELAEVGVCCIALFCYTQEKEKDLVASAASKKGNLLQRTISSIKERFPELCVIADIALDPFTSHGHDGLVLDGKIDNDSTIEVLVQMVLRAAEAGVDVVAPSDMMDGRVLCIRDALDTNGFCDVSILSYAVKYASSFYGPFRDALDSSPKFGDKKTYQMNTANRKEALLECALDEKEGADMLLIKPALTSLDVIAEVRSKTVLPIGAYQVSGEYSMIKAAAANGWIDEQRAIMETLICIKRAGADFIFTYAAKEAARLLKYTQ